MARYKKYYKPKKKKYTKTQKFLYKTGQFLGEAKEGVKAGWKGVTKAAPAVSRYARTTRSEIAREFGESNIREAARAEEERRLNRIAEYEANERRRAELDERERKIIRAEMLKSRIKGIRTQAPVPMADPFESISPVQKRYPTQSEINDLRRVNKKLTARKMPSRQPEFGWGGF